MVQPIPNGYHTLSPSFTFQDSAKAMEFYTQAFDAKTMDLMPGLDGKGVMHATMKIGNSMIMMGDAALCGQRMENLNTAAMSLFIYVVDVDATFKQAVAAGGTVTMPVMDMFWGDRAGQIQDPFGYKWMIATHKQDLTHEQIKKAAADFFTKMAKK